jgi:DNA-binding SARP family transcriptional activator
VTGLVEVTLLGPPRVERDGVLVAFDTRKAVALLAHLAVADRPRPRDALADLLWPGNDPEHARGVLRRTLSTLRGGVGGDLIEATRDHVRLIKGPTLVVDVDRFRRLRATGDLEQAAEVFRGDFLEGFGIREAPGFEDWARAEGDGLRRELTSALADLAAAREAAGDAAGAVEAVRRWLSLDPLHEPAHRALIRLYAASGDRAAALVQYRECVRTLSRELGVSPLAETTRLYDAINRGLYAAAETDTEPSPPPALGRKSPFVGRADDLRVLRACYDGVSADGRVVLIEGEAGIGKTRLAEELLAPLRRLGAQVLVARAHEDEAGLPYSPIVEILGARLAAGRDWLTDIDERALGEAARLVPELGSGRASERLTPLDEPGAETRFLSGVWDTLSAAAAGDTPGVLLVDDAQWADEATRGLLSYGLHRLGGRPLLVVLTWRTPNDHRLRNSAAAVARTSGGTVVHLGRLDEDAVNELVRAARPDGGSPAVSRRLWETTEGVPLLAVEYLRTLGTDDDWPLPTGARELLRARLDPVSETGRQVLAAAAVLGRSFDVDTVRAVSGRTDKETVTALEELESRGLVREGHFAYDFDHELVRSLVYDETSLARRRLLHGRAAEALSAPAGSVARHLHLAGRDAEAAAAYREAGEHARLVFANAEALGHLRAALALGHPDRAGLETAIGDLQTLLGDYAGALLSLESAAAASEPTELAPVEHRLGRVQHRRGEYALAEARLRAALAATPATDAGARAAITVDLSLAAHSRGHRDQARALAREASALATESADPRSRCQAYNLLGLLATADGDTDDALENLQRSRELADELGDQGLRVAALNNLALAHRARGELEDATKLTTVALDLCTALGDRHREAALHNNLADLLHAAGCSEDAMAHLKSAVEIFSEIGADEDPRPEIWKLVHW